MDHIRQAVERAKDSLASDPVQAGSAPLQPQLAPNAGAASWWGSEITLNRAHLESNRIIAHDVADFRSRSFDILRTQVLQSMDSNSWKVIGVTSPTPFCGKTTVSTNLALSIARQPGRSVLLVDMDLQKPQVAASLGLKRNEGLISTLEGKTKLPQAIVKAHIGNQQLLVLPCETSTLHSSEWMSSRSMSVILQTFKQNFRDWTVILDLPPILTSDDVISILPKIDCVLFVTAAGTSTVAEVKECNKHLETIPIVRIVMNKASDSTAAAYYSRYGHYGASREIDASSTKKMDA
jgi:protein-tyrosine kinase